MVFKMILFSLKGSWFNWPTVYKDQCTGIGFIVNVRDVYLKDVRIFFNFKKDIALISRMILLSYQGWYICFHIKDDMNDTCIALISRGILPVL